MTSDVMLTLGVVALLTLYTVALLVIRSNLRNDIRTLTKWVGELRLSNSKLDKELGAVAREGYELNARFEDHLLSLKPKPPARKAAAKKAPAKKAAPKKATPARKAPVSAR